MRYRIAVPSVTDQFVGRVVAFRIGRRREVAMPLLVADPVIVAPAQREALEGLGTSPLDLICLARIWKSAGRREHPLIDVQSLRVPLLPRIALGAVLLHRGRCRPLLSAQDMAD
jgi:hypothetical protein